jgi:hypothetical protein
MTGPSGQSLSDVDLCSGLFGNDPQFRFWWTGPSRDRWFLQRAICDLSHSGLQSWGIGSRLFRTVAEHLQHAGHVWVLEENPSRGFCEQMGGNRLATAERELEGKPLKEVSYGWPDLAAGVSHDDHGSILLNAAGYGRILGSQLASRAHYSSRRADLWRLKHSLTKSLPVRRDGGGEITMRSDL